VLHFRFGRKAQRNPWNADSLEWATPMPVTTYNFASLPAVRTRSPMWVCPDLPDRIERGEFGLAEPRHDLRETYGSDAVTGKLKEIIHLPASSWLPLYSAAAIAVMCVCLLIKSYLLALAALSAVMYGLLHWSWHNGAHPIAAPFFNDEPYHPPLHSRTSDGPGRWGMIVTLMANGTLFASLLFGWFYLWTAAPRWQFPAQAPIGLMPMLGAG